MRLWKVKQDRKLWMIVFEFHFTVLFMWDVTLASYTAQKSYIYDTHRTHSFASLPKYSEYKKNSELMKSLKTEHTQYEERKEKIKTKHSNKLKQSYAYFSVWNRVPDEMCIQQTNEWERTESRKTKSSCNVY